MILNPGLEYFLLPPFPLPPPTNTAYADTVQVKDHSRFPIKSLRDLRMCTYPSRFLKSEGTAYKQQVTNILNLSGKTTSLRAFVEKHETVDLWIYAYRANWYTKAGWPNRNAGDVDGRVKLLQDAIFSALGIDDSCVFFTGIRKVSSQDGEEKAMVVIKPVENIVDMF